MKRVLSLDGGGIRGIPSNVVLDWLERKLKRPAAQIFDLVAGTSTGGIAAAAMCKPNGLSAEQVCRMYQQRGGEIFKRSFVGRWLNRHGAWRPRYSVAGLERILLETFGELPLNSATTQLIVTAMDIMRCRPKVFDSHDPEDGSVLMRDVCRATSAAPTFFAPQAQFADGGIWANNPSMVALTEIRKCHPTEEVFLLSIGTGFTANMYDLGHFERAGAFRWLPAVGSMLMEGPQLAEDMQCRVQLGDKNYLRIQEPIQFASREMDDVSPRNLARLIAFGEWIIERRKLELETAAERLA